MKYLFFLFILCSIISCGGSDDGPPPQETSCGLDRRFIGNWKSVAIDDTVNVSIDCKTTGSYCSSSGSITPVANTDNQFLLFTNTIGNPREGCISDSQHCEFEFVNDNYLSLVCYVDGAYYGNSYERI